jgi:23S rRNA pseudouridine1911/1915/1917 synthase
MNAMTPTTRQHELHVPALATAERLDALLARLLPQYSRSRIASWIRAGEVTLDGRAAKPSEKVFGGEGVSLQATLEPDTQVLAEALPIDVVHADEELVVVNKPAGWVVHPGAGNREHTLQNALLAWDPRLAELPRAGLVHRIDKDTSGLLVVARTLESHLTLTRALAERDIHREYLALCVGLLTGGGTVDRPIGRHRTDRLRMAVRADGREAVTHYRLAERFRAHTLLRVQLETGRTHQIRVHLAQQGYPLVGDPLYGGRRQLTAGTAPAVRAALGAFRRQALHAARLELKHPASGAALTFEAPLPADLADLLAVLREDAATLIDP